MLILIIIGFVLLGVILGVVVAHELTDPYEGKHSVQAVARLRNNHGRVILPADTGLAVPEGTQGLDGGRRSA